jgi:hypothetical protein
VDEVLVQVVGQGPLLDEAVRQLARLGLEQAQVLPCCGILQIAEKCLSPVLEKFVKFVVLKKEKAAPPLQGNGALFSVQISFMAAADCPRGPGRTIGAIILKWGRKGKGFDGILEFRNDGMMGKRRIQPPSPEVSTYGVVYPPKAWLPP